MALTGIAARPARRRRACRVSRKLVASSVGVAVRSLAAWERGERAPTLKHAIDWARVLGDEIEMTGA